MRTVFQKLRSFSTFSKKVYIKIDGENCRMTTVQNARDIKLAITKTIQRRGFSVDDLHWHLYGMESRIPFCNELKKHFLIIPTSSTKQAADQKIKSDLEKMYEKEPACSVVLVSGDGGFTRRLMEGALKGFRFLVIGMLFEIRMARSLCQFPFSDFTYILLSRGEGAPIFPPIPWEDKRGIKKGQGAAKVFIRGVEITQPDLFYNGMIIVHGLQGFVSTLSPFSCDVERMTSLSFPFHPDHRSNQHVHSLHTHGATAHPAIMRLMLRDAMLRLRNNGFSILALAMKIKYAELVTLNNMTVFAVDDLSIFSGSHSYISNVRFHIVPNHYLSIADLEKLPVGTALPTLERGQPLLITTSGGAVTLAPMRINYVRVKVADVIRNVKIVVHSVYLPFPHINPVAAAYDTSLGGEGASEGAATVSDSAGQTMEGTCSALDGRGGCAAAGLTTTVGLGSVSPMPQVKPMVEIEDHHGL